MMGGPPNGAIRSPVIILVDGKIKNSCSTPLQPPAKVGGCGFYAIRPTTGIT